MHRAAQNGQLDVVNRCLKTYEDKNPGRKCEGHFKGRTPMHTAAELGQIAIVEAISNYLDNKNPQDAHGYTPLHSAALKTRILLQLLDPHGMDVHPSMKLHWMDI